MVGDDEAEDGVAQELLALVREGRRVLGAVGAVGYGPLEQRAVVEGPPEPRREGIETRVVLALGQRQLAPSLATT